MGPNEEDGGSSVTEKTPASTSDGMNLSRETPPTDKLSLSATSGKEGAIDVKTGQANFK